MNEKKSIEERHLELEKKRLELEHDAEVQRIELERERLNQEKRIGRRYMTTIIAALASLLTVVISATQVYTTKEIKDKEIELARLKTYAEEDRLWKTAFLNFTEKHMEVLFGSDIEEKSRIIALLESTFPTQHVTPFLSKRVIITADNPPSSKGSSNQILKELLEPLAAILEQTKSDFVSWTKDREYRYMESIFNKNLEAKSLIVSHSSLLPEELRRDAITLVEHYDDFFWRFEMIVRSQSFKPNSKFEFDVPTSKPFPRAAVERLFKSFSRSKKVLFNSPSSLTVNDRPFSKSSRNSSIVSVMLCLAFIKKFI